MSKNDQTVVDSIIEFCHKQRINDSSIHKGVYLSIIKFCQEEAKEMYQDELEAAVIKQCAEESTQNASAYAIGYSSGYKRALELVKWKIENELTQNNEQQ